MRIAVCLKQVYDLDGPFAQTEETPGLEDRGLVRLVSPADQAGLALVAAAGPAAEITALVVGPADTTPVLRWALAHGATAAARLWDESLTGPVAGPGAAVVLAAAVRRLGADLVVCGHRGAGYVGAALAERLGYAQVDHVAALALAGDRLELERRLGRGARQAVVTALPAVVTVDPGTAQPPEAALPALIRAQRADWPVWGLAELDLRPSDLPRPAATVTAYAPPRRRPRKSAEKALTPQQRMRQMMGGGAKAKAGSDKRVVEGPPEKLAAELIAFLEA
ncbi:MAG: hypothetical protein LBK54_06320 [Propionibacteriaceae bacterium]|jgi:electron transfer flavoprotein beta subunit|nr:hypothetical protein [Propionibacteriaceae bacterium]